MNVRETGVQKGIIGVILIVALVWLIFFTDYLPFSQKRTSRTLEELRSELQVVGGELQRLRSAVNSLPKIEKELETLEQKWLALRGLLPRESEMSTLLTSVTTAGMRAGVQFTLFEPYSPEPYDLYTRYPIRVSVTGSYHQVGKFFDNLCNLSRLVGISDIGLAQLPDGEDAATVEASVTLSAYAYKDAAEGSEIQTGSKGKK
jgi:type IV pilus assembly protein PilO